MKFNIISDLHCGIKNKKKIDSVDWMGFDPSKLVSADYLIVAGDAGYAETEEYIFKDLKKKTKGKFKDILHIKGNHSYWNFHPNLKLIETMDANDYIEVVDDNVAIIGTTLWTPEYNYSEMRYMNDYRYTPHFNGDIKVARYKEESNWLREKYNKYKNAGNKVVIVTHHIPRTPEQLPEEGWEHSDVSTAYWNLKHDLDDIKPDLWVCGHIHKDFDGIVDGVHFVRHPIGYRWFPYRYPNPVTGKEDEDTWYNKIVEV